VSDGSHKAPTAALELQHLVTRAGRLAAGGGRRLLAITGAPGAGKSTLAATLLDRLPAGSAALVPQDGFHLADTVLAQLRLSDRKGAPETFDANGFHALLVRLRTNDEPVVYAPEFHRDLETAVAGAIPVRRETPLVIVEGNYLLLDSVPWLLNRPLFDDTWYLGLPDETRQGRLIRRHEQYGKSAHDAAVWALGNDEQNAALVRDSARFADLLVDSTNLMGRVPEGS